MFYWFRVDPSLANVSSARRWPQRGERFLRKHRVIVLLKILSISIEAEPGTRLLPITIKTNKRDGTWGGPSPWKKRKLQQNQQGRLQAENFDILNFWNLVIRGELFKIRMDTAIMSMIFANLKHFYSRDFWLCFKRYGTFRVLPTCVNRFFSPMSRFREIIVLIVLNVPQTS